MEKDFVLERNLDFEERSNFDTTINYFEVAETYNKIVERCNKARGQEEKDKFKNELFKLLKKHGGHIELSAKVTYYKEIHGIVKPKIVERTGNYKVIRID